MVILVNNSRVLFNKNFLWLQKNEKSNKNSKIAFKFTILLELVFKFDNWVQQLSSTWGLTLGPAIRFTELQILWLRDSNPFSSNWGWKSIINPYTYTKLATPFHWSLSRCLHTCPYTTQPCYMPLDRYSCWKRRCHPISQLFLLRDKVRGIHNKKTYHKILNQECDPHTPVRWIPKRAIPILVHLVLKLKTS